MPQKDKHLKIVNNNYETLNHLVNCGEKNFSDWCVTIIFYMALHYVQAYFDKKLNYHPDYHPEIQQGIRSNRNLRPLYNKYRKLQTDSERARYLGKKFSIDYMRNTTLKHFKDIQNEIFILLKIQDKKEYDLYPLFPSN